MPKFKIALLTDGISPYVLGGMQKHSFYLAKYFSKIGVEVHLYHMNQSKYDINELEFFTTEEKLNIKNFVFEFPKVNKIPGHYIRASYRFSEILFETFKTESIHVDFVYAKGFTAWKLLQEKKKGLKCPPIGVNFHGYEMFQIAPNIKTKIQHLLLLRKPTQWISANADFVFSYGGKISPLIQSLGISKNKILEIPSGIGNEHIQNVITPTSEHQRKFIFIGRDESRKGIHELNLAIQNLLKENSFEFTFLGPIHDKNKIQHLNVKYLGEIRDFEQIKVHLNKNDVLVCPSYSEGMPNVILEAMSQGLAIIATDVGAVSTCVNEENGILIPNCDVKLIETALLNIIKLPSTSLNKLKQNSLFKCKSYFEWTFIANRNIELIKGAIK